MTSDSKKALLMILGGVLFVFFILKVSPPNTANFEGRVLKFRNSSITGKISALELFRQGNLITVNGEEYWFASHVGLEGRFINEVSVGDSLIKKLNSDKIWIIKEKTGKKMFFKFVQWDDVQ